MPGGRPFYFTNVWRLYVYNQEMVEILWVHCICLLKGDRPFSTRLQTQCCAKNVKSFVKYQFPNIRCCASSVCYKFRLFVYESGWRVVGISWFLIWSKTVKVCSDAKERAVYGKKREATAPNQYPFKMQPWFLSLRWKTCIQQNCSLGSCACS